MPNMTYFRIFINLEKKVKILLKSYHRTCNLLSIGIQKGANSIPKIVKDAELVSDSFMTTEFSFTR